MIISRVCFTDVGDSRTVFHFVSKVFYLQFRNKIMSDFSLLMHDDVIKCTTHFRGLKCDLRIDNKTSSVTVSGIGHNIWREDFFPVVARLLFAQYVKYADSQIYASFNDNCGAERKEASNRESATVAIGTEQTAESTQQPPAKGPLTTVLNIPMGHRFTQAHRLFTEQRHIKTYAVFRRG